MCEDGSHVQRYLMENHNSFMDCKLILQFFIWAEDHSWQRNGMKVAIKKREQQAAEEQKDNTGFDKSLQLQGLLVLGHEEKY